MREALSESIREQTMESSWISTCRVAPLLSVFVFASCTSSTPAASSSGDIRVAQGSSEQILLGRQLVLNHDCGGCHGGQNNPATKGWLAGLMAPTEPFHIGACNFNNPTAKPCYLTRPRNLTPDNATGLGRFTE